MLNLLFFFFAHLGMLLLFRRIFGFWFLVFILNQICFLNFYLIYILLFTYRLIRIRNIWFTLFALIGLSYLFLLFYFLCRRIFFLLFHLFGCGLFCLIFTLFLSILRKWRYLIIILRYFFLFRIILFWINNCLRLPLFLYKLINILLFWLTLRFLFILFRFRIIIRFYIFGLRLLRLFGTLFNLWLDIRYVFGLYFLRLFILFIIRFLSSIHIFIMFISMLFVHHEIIKLLLSNSFHLMMRCYLLHRVHFSLPARSGSSRFRTRCGFLFLINLLLRLCLIFLFYFIILIHFLVFIVFINLLGFFYFLCCLARQLLVRSFENFRGIRFVNFGLLRSTNIILIFFEILNRNLRRWLFDLVSIKLRFLPQSNLIQSFICYIIHLLIFNFCLLNLSLFLIFIWFLLLI